MAAKAELATHIGGAINLKDVGAAVLDAMTAIAQGQLPDVEHTTREWLVQHGLVFQRNDGNLAPTETLLDIVPGITDAA